MMEQLGIKALRPGPSGNESEPNHANYDESKANPYPDLPDPLTLKNGKKVTEANVKAVINAGGNGMPAYSDMLSDEERDNVIAYLKTL